MCTVNERHDCCLCWSTGAWTESYWRQLPGRPVCLLLLLLLRSDAGGTRDAGDRKFRHGTPVALFVVSLVFSLSSGRSVKIHLLRDGVGTFRRLTMSPYFCQRCWRRFCDGQQQQRLKSNGTLKSRVRLRKNLLHFVVSVRFVAGAGVNNLAVFWMSAFCLCWHTFSPGARDEQQIF